MLVFNVILLALLGLSSLSNHVESSAIKGHTSAIRSQEDARSIKLAQVSNQLDKKAVAAVQSPVNAVVQQQTVPILESSKKVYNDESIRRLVQQSPVVVEQAAKPVVEVVPAIVEPTKVQQAPVVDIAAAPIVAEKPKEVPVVAPVVAQPLASYIPEQQVAPAVSSIASLVDLVSKPATAPVAPKVPEEPSEEIVSKSAPMESSENVIAKPADQLPAASERSAQIRNDPSVVAPAVVPAVVPAVEQPVASPAVQVIKAVELVPVVQVQPAVPIVPVAAPVAPIISEPAKVVPVVAVAEPAKQSETPLEAKKEEGASIQPASAGESPLHIEVPAPDPQLVLSEPIDSTTKLLIDLDEHVQKFLPLEDQQQPAQPPKEPTLLAGVDFAPAPVEPSGKSAPLVPYSDESLVPQVQGDKQAAAGQPAASPENPISSSGSSQSAGASGNSVARQGAQNQNQQQVITQLLDQLDSLQNRIQDTINQLQARRRYVMSALLRPMGTYVRRVRTNLERLQNRVNQLQAAAVSVGGGNGNRPGGFVDAAAIDTIRRRIDDISKRISDIVNRIRFSLTPTSAPLNSNGRK